MARTLRAPFVVVTAMLAGCSEPGSSSSTPDAQPDATVSDARPTPVPCSSALKGGEPCVSGNCWWGSCEAGMGKLPGASCVGGQWRVYESPCNPPAPTVGNPCSTNDECDLTGEAINVCSRGAWAGDSRYATNVCIGTACDPLSAYCDGAKGVCLSTDAGSICVPRCAFDDSGAAPTGCVAKNACVAHITATGDAGVTSGVGYCVGGCTNDEDCLPAGEQKCQRETGLCVRTPVTYTKPLGASCSDADKNACNCSFNPTTKLGYCTQFCRAGVDTCPAGFACDPRLPDAFTTIPLGISGRCLKECATDADCTALNATCTASAGLAVKTCKP